MNKHLTDENLRIAVDIGGTFTDGVATLAPEGRIWVSKSPTTPDDPGRAVSEVILDLLSHASEALGIETLPVREVVHGTTLITNTLIERKGSHTALVTTEGMRDMLDIGREWRYDIYDLEIQLPRPLVPSDARLEIGGRLDARGAVLEELTEESLDAMVAGIKALGAESVAISLLHSYVNPEHEQRARAHIEKKLPGTAVSISSDLAREINEYERTSTAVANAYVQPIVAAYLEQLDARLSDIRDNVPLRVMVSSGGFSSAESGARSPILLLESGPAAGVLSALNTARQHGVDQVLAFDMGGTTAKACVSAGGTPPVAHSFECARVERFKRGSGLPILIPSIELIEIGAGGGSIAHRNRLGLLNIGPESSGSVPGPACYGKGGADPTVTDADLLLGYLNADRFLGGTMKLDKDAATGATDRLADDLGVTTIETAWGICNIVNENMASAARIHIAENGFDPRDFTMVATGGAGPVHAVDVARKLRIPRVLVPIAAGAGSCLGMLAAPARIDRSWSKPQLVADVDWSEVADQLGALQDDARQELEAAGASEVTWTIGAEMRYVGQGAELPVVIPFHEVGPSTGDALIAEFEKQYKLLYGRLVPDASPQIITWRLVGQEPSQAHHFEWGDDRTEGKVTPDERREIYLPLRGDFESVGVYDRYSLPPGTVLNGPLILEERESTIVVGVEADVTILPDLTVSIAIKEFE
ncbi:hydantoinase/oxoprolinase family protein [Roseisalinus antarcticus]|uniref:Acetophenone carboxylase gamma subunit n=1 Tax=Roseisalinus antarcticus TaxID=254357 RepID=A0A1Y5T6F3_9RHOB|nr:hydantoinase/oxoprolinase family protein [Roseisalinus antarcticus]SLN56966.1 Acetophenone carboxylase gamma subunit [Roseisalinus antarcticus]